jgi:hypothetical protein
LHIGGISDDSSLKEHAAAAHCAASVHQVPTVTPFNWDVRPTLIPNRDAARKRVIASLNLSPSTTARHSR